MVGASCVGARPRALLRLAERCHGRRNGIPRHTAYPRLRQRAQQLGAVVAQQRAAVEEDDGPTVGARSNEAAEPLAQTQRGLRQMELAEGVLVALRAALDERVVGNE